MRKKILTERAHYMCPDMHFGIAAEINGDFDEARLRQTAADLQTCHPLLKCLITTDDDGQPYYETSDQAEVPIRFGKDSRSWLGDYGALTAKGWDLRKDCLLRIIAYPRNGHTFAVFAAHHLLCDGLALWHLVELFAALYTGSAQRPVFEDRLIASADEFGGKLKTPFMLKILTASANKKWAKAGKNVSYDAYRTLELNRLSRVRTERSTESVSDAELQAVYAKCKQNGMTVNDWLIADMMTRERTDTVMVGADIRKHLANHEAGALGNFSSAYSVKAKVGGDVWETGRAVAAATRRIKDNPQKELLTLALYLSLDQRLLDAAAISALGGFVSEAGLFVGDRLLGLKTPRNHILTNLGRFDSDVVTEAWFVPPCSPSAKLSVGALTVNGRLNRVLCG